MSGDAKVLVLCLVIEHLLVGGKLSLYSGELTVQSAPSCNLFGVEVVAKHLHHQGDLWLVGGSLQIDLQLLMAVA